MLDEKDLEEARERLNDAFGERLSEVILYGSEARGEAGCDSDVDLLVVLEEPVTYAEDLRKAIHVLYPMTLRIERSVLPHIVGRSEYATEDSALFRNVQRQGDAFNEP
jgi:predicted nucleotidyltransferase